MPEDRIVLDDEAERFFKELGGIESDLSSRLIPRSEQMAEGLDKEEQALDAWYILLVDLAGIMGSFLIDGRLLERTATENPTFRELLSIIRKLAQRPLHDNAVLIKYRGSPKPITGMGKTDYQVLFGDISIDMERVQNIVARRGPDLRYLASTIDQAFEAFSNSRINNIYLRFPLDDYPDDIENLFVCFQILSRYETARKTNSPIYFYNKKGRQFCPIMFNELNRSDLNLTLLAGLNELKPEFVYQMVEKIDRWLTESSENMTAGKSVDVFSALFKFKNFKNRLIKPSVEVNNIKWLIQQSSYENASGEAFRVGRLVLDSYGDAPHKAARLLASIYGNDYKTIEPWDLGERLDLASDLLDTIEKKNESLEIENEVVGNIEMRLDVVNDMVYEALFIDGPVLSINVGGKRKTLSEKINEKISRLIRFFKDRVVARNKLKSMHREITHFADKDYQTLAKDFGINIQTVKYLIELFKECFDADGCFRRAAFEHNIPEFACYEKKVFVFLLHYLKETVDQNDRVSFLNSLQLLIAELDQPTKAMEILLDDFLKDPKSISFSDRNSIMLANLLIRKYNKEPTLYVEITPEEVLLGKESPDKHVIRFTAAYLEENREKIFDKIRSIHRQLIFELDVKRKENITFPVRYLFSLEREIYIFLSLVGGALSTGIVRSALREYGNPDADVYRLRESRENILNILQLLRIIIRGMGRLGADGDTALIEEIKHNRKGFEAFGKSKVFHEHIERIIEWTNLSQKQIRKISSGCTSI